MNFEQLMQNINPSQLDKQAEQKRTYILEQRDKLRYDIDEKISSIILVKKRKLDYTAYTQAAEKLKIFLTSAKYLVNVYFDLLDDQDKLLVYNFPDLKDLVFKMRFCLFRSVHNLNRMLIKENQGPQNQAKFLALAQSSDEGNRKLQSGNQKKKKRKKGKNSKMPIEQTGCMYRWILQNFQNPYPSQEQKQKLSSDSKISISKVNYWFINIRQRTLKKLINGDSTCQVKKKKTQKAHSSSKGQSNSEQLQSQMLDEPLPEGQSS